MSETYHIKEVCPDGTVRDLPECADAFLSADKAEQHCRDLKAILGIPCLVEAEPRID